MLGGTVRSSRKVLGPNSGGVVKVYFSQTPKAVMEASRGDQRLSRFMAVPFAKLALSEHAREEFSWLK